MQTYKQTQSRSTDPFTGSVEIKIDSKKAFKNKIDVTKKEAS